MKRVYTSWPEKSDTKGSVTRDVPDMGALDLPYRGYEPGRLEVEGTESELDTLEGDSLWVRL